MLVTARPAAAAPSQVIAAGTSSTNLRTENVFPGAQNPPYICCWGAQGQFVTFSFDVAGGATDLALRYSAGGGDATRKLELDGSPFVGNEIFPGTPDWSTWNIVSSSTTLTGGTHTLTVLFDATAGSQGSMNLDDLTVDQPAAPPPGVEVSLGYADDATGLSPWSGSPNTTYIGETAQCCATHGPDNGFPGYDGGAIEVANTSASPVTVNAMTVDFGGGSSPSHYDLWGGSTTPSLPQTLAPGADLVMTSTSFNFDTSDLRGEACNVNSDVVPVVHLTFDGTSTDYRDDHQILNSDGSDIGSCPRDTSEQHAFTVVAPGSQSPAAAVNDVPPSVTAAGTANAPATPVVGRVVSGLAGGWNASPPPALSLQWTRCNAGGGGCVGIPGATRLTYVPATTDVGSTLRLLVTASNGSGAVAASSAPTPVVQSGPAVAQLGHTLTGSTAALIDNTGELSWLDTATASGTTNDFAFFARGAGNDQVFTPRIYSVVNGQKHSVLATGAAIKVPRATDARWYVSKLSGLHLAARTQYVFALDPSGTFNGTYVGEETTGEPSFYVDYTRTSSSPTPTSAKSGYWMLAGDGRVYAFGNATNDGNAKSPAMAFADKLDGTGYWVVDPIGDVSHFGSAADHGGRPALRPGEIVSTISATPSGNGYWLFTNTGRVFGYGDAHFYGDLSALRLAGAIVASVATPTGHGYYMVGSDGGVFSFGDAHFHGSTGNMHLNRPIVGMAPTPDNHGYWLVASDGGVFAFDAPFRGSMGGTRLNEPVNGLVAYGTGYLMVASDGGVFDFSDRPFRGSLGSDQVGAPIIAIVAFNS